MAENSPNSKGPAKTQLSPEQMASFGVTPTPETAVPAEPTPVPADQVKPEEIATLAIEYRDGQPVVVVSDGKYVQSELPVVNSSGVAYAARFAWTNGVAHLHTPDTPDPVSAPVGSPWQPDFLAVDRYEADDFTTRG
ncbi:hypothetical protein ACWGLE_25215 [Streptomyces sp. NPDC055897]